MEFDVISLEDMLLIRHLSLTLVSFNPNQSGISLFGEIAIQKKIKQVM